MMMPIAKPSTNPDITAFERKLETHPMRAMPSSRYTTPVVMASAAVMATASSVPIASEPTMGRIAAPDTAATAALGPCTSWREVPKSA